jgi:UDP-GlcNAc:undecaprenyl-phosphate GlcNAc-1-phosphate transferase
MRFGWVDLPGVRKLHGEPIPRAGGIAIFLGYAAAICTHHAWTILPAAVVTFGTGLLDDLVSLKPRTKIAGQTLAALLACASGIQIRNLGGHAIHNTWWQVPLTVLWLAGCTNAINLIDGLDGLAAGVGLTATAAAFLTALLTGNAALTILTAPLLGALLGFLPYNFNPASIFMGDSGSNTIGFLLGCFAIMWSHGCATLPMMAAPLIALAIPILDTALAIFRRFLRQQPVSEADRGHIHHRLLSRGFSPRRVACILYVAGGLLAGLSILLTTGAYSGGPVLAAFGILIWMALRYLRYDEFTSVRNIFFGGVVRRALSTDLFLRQLEGDVSSAASIDECWFALQSIGPRLGLSSATMHVYGRTFSAQFSDSQTAGDCWNMTVSLNGVGTIDLEIPFGRESSSASPVANSLRTVLAPKLEALRPKLAFAAAAGGARGSLRRW